MHAEKKRVGWSMVVCNKAFTVTMAKLFLGAVFSELLKESPDILAHGSSFVVLLKVHGKIYNLCVCVCVWLCVVVCVCVHVCVCVCVFH